MRTSIVIPHYGEPGQTLALIDALRPQNPHQIIVSDDCSPQPFPQTSGVTVVRRDTNGGFGSAVNFGAKHATGDSLLILNSDLIIDATFLAQLHDKIGPLFPVIASPRILNKSGEPTLTARKFPKIHHHVAEWLTPLARFHGRPWYRRLAGIEHPSDETQVVDWVVGAVLFLPLDSFRTVGGFDERFYMNCEEVDLQRRLREIGVGARLVPSVQAIHVGGGSSDPAKRRIWLVQARGIYARRWGGFHRLRAALTVATCVNLGWNITRKLRGIPVPPFKRAKAELDLIWKS